MTEHPASSERRNKFAPLELDEEQQAAQRQALRKMWEREYRGWERAKVYRFFFEIIGVLAVGGGVAWLALLLEHSIRR